MKTPTPYYHNAADFIALRLRTQPSPSE